MSWVRAPHDQALDISWCVTIMIRAICLMVRTCQRKPWMSWPSGKWYVSWPWHTRTHWAARRALTRHFPGHFSVFAVSQEAFWTKKYLSTMLRYVNVPAVFLSSSLSATPSLTHSLPHSLSLSALSPPLSLSLSLSLSLTSRTSRTMYQALPTW